MSRYSETSCHVLCWLGHIHIDGKRFKYCTAQPRFTQYQCMRKWKGSWSINGFILVAQWLGPINQVIHTALPMINQVAFLSAEATKDLKNQYVTGPINMFQKAKTTWPIKWPCKNTNNHYYEVEALGVCSTCWKRQVMVVCVQCPSPWMKHLKKAGNIDLKKWRLSFKTNVIQTNEREAELH